MLWFVTVTQECNFACKYCGSSENYDIEDLSPFPTDITYDIAALTKLSSELDLVLCFYGGEPLLRIDAIVKIMALLPMAKFVLQTNASRLNDLPTAELLQFSTILVSIDGDASVTDASRGPGAYELAVENSRDARDRGFAGDLIARMTVSDDSDIYRDVVHLLSLEHSGRRLFDHVHWQLNVQWDTPAYSAYRDFFVWRDERYNPGVSRLAADFVANLRRGIILGIVPFLGVVWTTLTGQHFRTVRCSSGWESFNIATNGDITACPIAPELKALGHIATISSPTAVHHKVIVEEPCDTCDVLAECGGRCLYCNQTKWWDDEGFAAVCVTVRHFLAQVREVIMPVVNELIAAQAFTPEDFHYPPFNNTTEIIP